MKKNWLKLNLGSLLRGKVEIQPPSKGKLSEKPVLEGNSGKFRPGRYYRWSHSGWGGPHYSPRHLLHVLEELSAIVGANASLAKGLEVCATEEQRKYPTLYDPRMQFIRGAIAILVLIATFLIDVMLFIEDGRVDSPPLSLGVLFFLLLLSGLRWRRQRYEALYLHMRDDLHKGDNLSESMQRLHRFFPRFYADLVAAGEESGNLHRCLPQISASTVSAIDFGKSLRGTLTYFTAVITFNSLIMVFILMQVVPIFQEMIRDLGITEVPFALKFVFALGPEQTPDMFKNIPYNDNLPFAFKILYTIPLWIVLYFAWRSYRRNNFFFRRMGAISLYLPYFRGIFIQQNLLRIATMLQHYLEVGMPLDRALELIGNSDIHAYYKRAVKHIRDQVVQGESLADALEDTARRFTIAKSFRSLAALGERSGMLAASFEQIGALYHDALKKKVSMFTELLSPVCILAYGIFVGFFVVGIFSILVTLSDGIIGTM